MGRMANKNLRVKNSNKVGQSKKIRYPMLDFLRGIAVFFMICTHANGTFWDGSNLIMDFLTWWGAVVCFTMFLFLFGAIYGIKSDTGKLDRRKMLRRGLYFLGSYYVLAFILVFLREGFSELLKEVLDILIFIKIPEFVEFVLPFSLYCFIFAAVLPMLKWVKKNYSLALFLSFLIFGISLLLYKIDWGSGYLNVIKGLLVGHRQLHRFGLISYLPVLTLGLVYGSNFIKNRSDSTRFAIIWLIVGIILCVQSVILGYFELRRWPPSLEFLSFGLITSSIVMLLYPIVSKAKIVESFVSYMGRNSYIYYMYHLILIFLVVKLFNPGKLGDFATFVMLIMVFAVTSLFVWIRKRFSINNFMKRSA